MIYLSKFNNLYYFIPARTKKKNKQKKKVTDLLRALYDKDLSLKMCAYSHLTVL